MDLFNKDRAQSKSAGEKNQKSVKAQFTENPLTTYCHFIYRMIGRSLLMRPKFKKFFTKSIYNKKYENILRMSNLKLLPEEYFLSVFLTVIGSFLLICTFTALFLFINTLYAIFTFYGGIIGISVLGISLYNYPLVVSKKREKEIEASIPYVLPYLKLLSRELTLSKIVQIIDQFLVYKEIRVEFRKIKYYSEVLGYDIHSSIREAMSSCPSKELSDILNDLVTISNSGGNIYTYLTRKLENMNAEIESLEKKNIDTLLILSQIYVVLLLIAPLFFTIMTSILNLIEFSASSAGGALGGAGGSGGTVSTIVLLLVFLPLGYVAFMMMVYYSKPLYSRLKPIDEEEQE